MFRGTLTALLVASLGLLVAASAHGSVERYYAAGARQPDAMAEGPDGRVWFTWREGLGRIAEDGRVTLHPTPGVRPVGLAAGPDGALWFTEPDHDRVGRMAVDGVVTMFSTGIAVGARPYGIARGPDDAIWFTEQGANRIARITPSGTVTEFGQMPVGTQPAGIVTGPDGNLWFTWAKGFGQITQQGVMSRFDVGYNGAPGHSSIVSGHGRLWAAGLDSFALVRILPDGRFDRVNTGAMTPHAIALGPGGQLWYTLHAGLGHTGAHWFDRVLFRDPFDDPPPLNPVDDSVRFTGLAFAADGAAWAADNTTDSLLRVGSATGESPLEAVLRNRGAFRRAHAFALGPGGSVWIATGRAIVRVSRGGERRVFRIGKRGPRGDLLVDHAGMVWFADEARVGRLDTRDGRVTYHRIGRNGRSGVSSLALGPDGRVWFVDAGRGEVGSISRSGRVRVRVRGFGRRAALLAIASGPDGRLWVTDQSGAIHRVSLRGAVRHFSAGLDGRSNPAGIAAGPDGNMWFTELRAEQVARITPSGRITEFPVREAPVAITAGHDGAVWFTTAATSDEDTVAGLGRITISGVVSQFYVARSTSASYRGLLAAVDGRLWMTVSRGPISVARVSPRRLAATAAIPGG